MLCGQLHRRCVTPKQYLCVCKVVSVVLMCGCCASAKVTLLFTGKWLRFYFLRCNDCMLLHFVLSTNSLINVIVFPILKHGLWSLSLQQVLWCRNQSEKRNESTVFPLNVLCMQVVPLDISFMVYRCEM